MDDDLTVERVLRSAPEVFGEVMPGVERRRGWVTEEKLCVLAQSAAPGSSLSLICQMHGISRGQLYTWRKQFRRGELTGFVPVYITEETIVLPSPDLPPEPLPVERDPTGARLIEVELPNGINFVFRLMRTRRPCAEISRRRRDRSFREGSHLHSVWSAKLLIPWLRRFK